MRQPEEEEEKEEKEKKGNYTDLFCLKQGLHF